jgi:integrase
MSAVNASKVSNTGGGAEASAPILSFGHPIAMPLEAFSDLQADSARAEVESAGLPVEVRALLLNYSTRSSPERIRQVITAFVTLAVVAVAPQNCFTCEQVTAPVARLAIWAHHARAFPLLPSLLFSPEVLELFVAEQLVAGEISAGTLRNYRAHLVRVGSALGLTGAFAQTPIQRVQGTGPYSKDEILGYTLWARGRSSPRSRARAGMILALSMGAGLRNEEVLAVRASDVISADEMWVRVRGDHDRLAPVRAEWRPMLRKRLESLASDDYVYPDADKMPTGHITGWLASLKDAPQGQRLRTTWLVHHLENRTDIASLLAWAGIARGESLARYLPYLPGPIDRELHLALMRARHPAP